MFRSARHVVLPLAALAVWAAPGLLQAGSYTVQPGDTLSGLAERFETTQARLLALNPSIRSADLLFADARITLPDEEETADAAPTAPTSGSGGAGVRLTHVVQPGDTVSGLTFIYETTTAEIVRLNPGLESGRIQPGMQLVVRDDRLGAGSEASGGAPAAPTSSGGPRIGDQPVRIYEVAPGDTFSEIALHFGTTQAQLAALNSHVDPNFLPAGAVLLVPRAGVSTPTGTSRMRTYVVEAGDTASGIALRFATSLEALAKANGGADLSTVFVGQRLRLPIESRGLTEAAIGWEGERATYLVRAGNTASGIAAAHRISLGDLRRLNLRANLDLLQVGQALVVPLVDLPPPAPGTVPAGPAPGLRHSVQAGETLTAIAATFGETPQTLAALNPGLNPNLLSVGQDLRVPGTVAVPTVSRTVVTASGDSIAFVAAEVGVTPHTLLANNPGLSTAWIPAGTPLRVPRREGVIVDVFAGDTLRGIAAAQGTTVLTLALAADNGVSDPNGLIAGQEILIPVTTPEFVWPAQGLLTDGFGACRTWDCSLRHHGTDIAQNDGAALAMAAGTVTFAGGSYCCGLGFHLEIDHGNGWLSRYGHLAGPPWVVEGEEVAAGEPIGQVGTTGFSTGVHLHVELEHNGWLLDALNYVP